MHRVQAESSPSEGDETTRVGRSRSGPVFGTPFGPSLGLGIGPVSVHLGHGPVRS